MKKFFKNRCVFGLIVVVIVLSVVIGVVNAVNSDVKFTENVFQVIITPVQGMLEVEFPVFLDIFQTWIN